MKKNFLLLGASIFLSVAAICQKVPEGNHIQVTIKNGSVPNSAYITFKSDTTYTVAKFSSFLFVVGLPTSITPRPTLTITSLDPLMAYFPTQESIETQNGDQFYAYAFSGDGSQGGSGTDYTANTEYNYAEVFFPDQATRDRARLMSLPNGGTTGNVYWYVANKGADVTNQPAMFYSDDPRKVSNDPNGYTGSSFVLLTIALPIKVSSFDAAVKNDVPVLHWTSENQDANSDRFEIERSLDGKEFNTAGSIHVSSKPNDSYTFTDHNTELAGTIFYRLKMVDKDGKFTYSDTKSVVINKVFSVKIYPNPISTDARVNISLENSALIKIEINDILGNKIRQVQFNSEKGINEKTVDFSNLSSGSYIIKIQAGNKSKTLSVLKN